MLESVFNKVAGLFGYFEEHLWPTASVVNTINTQNFIIIWLKELKFYFASFVLNPVACNLVKNGLNHHRCFCFLQVFCKWTNEQNPHF